MADSGVTAATRLQQARTELVLSQPFFGVLALAGQWAGGGPPGWAGLPLAYPAVAAAPAAAGVLWMARRAGRW